MRKFKFRVCSNATEDNSHIVGIEKFRGKEIIIESPDDKWTHATCRLPKSNIINRPNYGKGLEYICEV